MPDGGRSGACRMNSQKNIAQGLFEAFRMNSQKNIAQGLFDMCMGPTQTHWSGFLDVGSSIEEIERIPSMAAGKIAGRRPRLEPPPIPSNPCPPTHPHTHRSFFHVAAFLFVCFVQFSFFNLCGPCCIAQGAGSECGAGKTGQHTSNKNDVNAALRPPVAPSSTFRKSQMNHLM